MGTKETFRVYRKILFELVVSLIWFRMILHGNQILENKNLRNFDLVEQQGQQRKAPQKFIQPK